MGVLAVLSMKAGSCSLYVCPAEGGGHVVGMWLKGMASEPA